MLRNQPHGGGGREDVGAARHILLENVVLDGAAQLADIRALAFGDRNIHRQQDARRGVDRHRGGDFLQRNLVEELLHIADGRNRDAHLAHFALGDWVIGIVADLRGQVEGHRKPGLPGAQQITVAFVRFFGSGKAGVLAHRPEAPAIHGGLDAPGKRVFAREAEFFSIVGVIVSGRQDGGQFDAG